MSFLSRKISQRHVWERIFRERLTEPLHMNFLSLFVALFGGVRSKIAFDLLVRQHNAFALLNAADRARGCGVSAFTAVEFGVAAGAGLLNLCELAEKITRVTGVNIRVVGFDSGAGMPPSRDYRDHPNFYATGDFPMPDFDGLRARLPASAQLVLGNISETLPPFLTKLSASEPLGYVVLDVDYYWSSVECLKILSGPSNVYLPDVLVYADDVTYLEHNVWQGELAAIADFNRSHEMRKIGRLNNLTQHRLFRNATWLTQMYAAHVLDHPDKSHERIGRKVVLQNPYLRDGKS
jgi:hypothetical protein